MKKTRSSTKRQKQQKITKKKSWNWRIYKSYWTLVCKLKENCWKKFVNAYTVYKLGHEKHKMGEASKYVELLCKWSKIVSLK